ncbi:DUF742 domain-containing protein [Streptomyces fragilis]|uniref:DUF742 domain-containing protein n=1 Tax=Streptomyces fragilis TaxID=67301 RepID=A0ABV2YH14_9ACTN|nr:DUF742 domain-containing protein [Streptomyces fragilis]
MATPPGGPNQGGWSYDQGQSGQHGEQSYDFSSAAGHTHQQPYAPQNPQGPGQHSPYGQPAAPYDRSAASQRRAHESSSAGGQSQAAKNNPLVRPYAMTGGRTRPRYQLAIEALVHTTAQPHQMQGQLPEHQRICNLCREIKSVAEVSALLQIPLGVARILVADLAEAGLVAIHQPGGDESAGGQPDVTLLERVLSGLRKL